MISGGFCYLCVHQKTDKMKYLTLTSTDPHYNMAFDEFCLENLDNDEPVFYLWRNSPSVIIGLNQNAMAEVNLPFIESHGILLARRTTGGGAVYHDLQNLNYTIVGKHLSPNTMVEALRGLGVPAVLTGRNDIFVGGLKVSGYARRVYKDREMIHGTLMWDVDIDTLTEALNVPGSKLNLKGVASVRSRVGNLKGWLPQIESVTALQAELQIILAGTDEEIVLSEEQLAVVSQARATRFATRGWNYRD